MKCDKLMHPLSRLEISNYTYADPLETMTLKLDAYQEIRTQAPIAKEVADKIDRDENDRARWAFLINRELLLTALPAALITYTFTWLLKTKSRKDALWRGIIWTCILALYYILISIGNGSFDLMFGTIGVYALLICAFGGTMIYSILKRLR